MGRTSTSHLPTKRLITFDDALSMILTLHRLTHVMLALIAIKPISTAGRETCEQIEGRLDELTRREDRFHESYRFHDFDSGSDRD